MSPTALSSTARFAPLSLDVTCSSAAADAFDFRGLLQELHLLFERLQLFVLLGRAVPRQRVPVGAHELVVVLLPVLRHLAADAEDYAAARAREGFDVVLGLVVLLVGAHSSSV